MGREGPLPCSSRPLSSPLRTSSFLPSQWDSLQIPVSIAFFFLNSSMDRVAAFYPGPAGATESELPLDTWDEVFGTSHDASGPPFPMWRRSLCERDRAEAARSVSSFPIDACYELVGQLRGSGGASTAAARPRQAMDELLRPAFGPGRDDQPWPSR